MATGYKVNGVDFSDIFATTAESEEGGSTLAFRSLEMGQGSSAKYAVCTRGMLWSWGGNEFGTLGNGDNALTNSGFTLVPLDYNKYELKSVHAMTHTTYVLLTDRSTGKVDCWGWGKNDRGQLRTGDAVDVFYPRLVFSDVDRIWFPKNLAWDPWFCVYAKRVGSTAVRIWGHLDYNRLGTTSSGIGHTEQTITLPPNTTAQSIKELYNMGGRYGCTYIVNSNNEMFAIGFNDNGNLGTGDNVTPTSWRKLIMPTSQAGNIKDVYGGYGYHDGRNIHSWAVTFVLFNDGKAKVAGRNRYNNNGLGLPECTTFRDFNPYGPAKDKLIINGCIGVHAAQGADGRVVFWGYDHLINFSKSTAWTIHTDMEAVNNYIPAPHIDLKPMKLVSSEHGAYSCYNRPYMWWEPNGIYYIASANPYGESGNGTKVATGFSDQLRIPIARDEVVVDVQMAARYNGVSIYALTDKGRLYGVGYGGDGGWDANPIPSLYHQNVRTVRSTWSRMV